MIVFLGLWIEKDADKEAKMYPSAFARAVKLVRLKAEIGWWVLMAGISIEILVAIGLAIREEHVARTTADKIANNDLRNLPIMSIEVVRAYVIINTEADDETSNNAILLIGRPNQNRTNVTIFECSGKIVGRGGGGTTRMCEMQFQMDLRMMALRRVRPDLTANELNSVAVYLPRKFGSVETVIQGGQLKLIINATIWKEFNFPPQTNARPVATSFLTNNAFIPLTSEQLMGL